MNRYQYEFNKSEGNLRMNSALLEEIQNSIKNTVADKKIGVAFSGGVDSTLVSKICTDLGYEITLLTIGFPNSHDIEFAQEVNSKLNYKHAIYEIESDSFNEISKNINKKIQTDNISWNENCIAFYYVSKLAKKLEIIKCCNC